ncbi:MAG: YhbY family RNA-binding protein [Nanoarchaeota archaeon]
MDAEIKKQAKNLKPLVRVGKSGLTNTLLEEIKKHLKKRRLVKVKFLKNSPYENIKDLAEEIANSAQCEIITVMGLTVVFYKKRK